MRREVVPNKNDVPIVLRDTDLEGLLVYKSSDQKKNIFTVYYLLSDGKFFLKDAKNDIGSRYVNLNKGDIICVLTEHETGYENLCGWLNELGDTIQEGNSKHTIPDRLHNHVHNWCKMRNLI